MRDPKAVIHFAEVPPGQYGTEAANADMDAVKEKVQLAARKHMGIGHDEQSVAARRNETRYMVVFVFQSDMQAGEFCEAMQLPDSMFIDGMEYCKREGIPLTHVAPMAFRKAVDNEILAMSLPVEDQT